MKITFFENRYASDNKILKQKAETYGKRIAKTLHEDMEWMDFVEDVVNKNSWETFTANDKTSYEQCKKNFDGFIFGEMKPDMPRSSDNIIAFHAIALDIDGGATYQEVRDDLKDFEYVLYSSGGTGLKKGDRFRVVLPLAKILDIEQWKEWAASLKKRFNYSDESFSKSLQIQYLPTYNTEYVNEFISYHNTGRWLDVMSDVEFIKPVPCYINTLVPVYYEFSDTDRTELLRAIIEHSRGGLEYEERRKLANRLAALGINNFDMVQVLDAVGRPGAAHSGSDMASMANSSYGHIAGLRKNLPSGYKLPMPVIQPTYINTKPVITEHTKYDYDITLNYTQFLSDVVAQFKIEKGINLLICDCGVGKSYYWSKRQDVIMIAPLLSIVKQNMREGAKFNNIHDGVATYHQIEKIINDVKNHGKYNNMTLVVDEAHSLYLDAYRDKVNQMVSKCFSLFKSVVLMSGTIRREYFSNLEVVNTIRVRKVQPFEKVLTRIHCEGDVVGTAIKRINERQHKNKMVILLNDKDGIKVVRSKLSGVKCLEYTAVTKKTAEIDTLLNSSVLSEQYDCLIGTNSIVEGLNINDDLKNCEVHIIGDCTPERIEQVTNRWRKCTGTIHTYHYTPSIMVSGDLPELDSEITAQDYIDIASDSANVMNRYIQLLGDQQRKKYVNTYRHENRTENVYWNDNTRCFEVSFIKIDYQMAANRFERSKSDFNRYAQELTEYGFKFTVPQRAVVFAEVAKERAVVAQDKKELYQATIDLVISQVHERGWEVGTDNFEAQVQRDYVDGFIRRGLKRSDVADYLERLKVDPQYWQYLKADINDARYGNSIRDLIIRELPNHLVTYGKYKKQGLTAQGKRELAEKVVRYVLVERFNGDVLQMRSGGWDSVMRNDPRPDSNTYINDEHVDHLSKDDKAPDAVLNRFITLGKSERSRINESVERVTPVKYCSRTGFDFDSKNNTDLADAIKSKKRQVVDTSVLPVPNTNPVESATVSVLVPVIAKSKLKSSISNRRVI